MKKRQEELLGTWKDYLDMASRAWYLNVKDSNCIPGDESWNSGITNWSKC